MLIKEIIEMTKEKPVPIIARDHLEIGEKKLRDTLKELGGHHQKGEKGWTFQGDSEVLEKSIYDFAKPTKKAKAATKEQTNKVAGETLNKIPGETINENTGETSNNISGETIQKKTGELIKKRASFDLDVESLKKLKHYAIDEDLNLSEVVDRAIYLFLNSKGL